MNMVAHDFLWVTGWHNFNFFFNLSEVPVNI